MDDRFTAVTINTSVFLLMLGVGWMVPLLPLRVLELSGSLCQVGYLASSFAVSYLLFQLPLGALSDTIGMKALLLAGYLTCGISGLLFAHAQTIELLFVARFLQGIGEVPVWATGPALLALLFPSATGRQAGIYSASLHGGLTAGTLSGMWLNMYCKPQTLFYMFSGSALVAALLVLLFAQAPVPRNQKIKRVVTWPLTLSLLKKRSFRRLYAGISFYGVGYGAFVTLIPAWLSRNGSDTSLFFALFYMGIGAAQLLGARLSDGERKNYGIAVGLTVAGMGLSLFPEFTAPWHLVPLTFAALGLGIFCVCAFAELSDGVSETMKGTASGAFFACWGVGYFTGPMLLGKLADRDLFHLGFSGFGVLCILLGVWGLLPAHKTAEQKI